MYIKIKTGILLSIFLLAGCRHQHTHEDTHTHDTQDTHAHDETPSDEVVLTKAQIQKVGLTMGTFENKNLQATLKVNGKLELPPQNKASVSAIIQGKVTRIHVQPGQRVNKGAVLATLQNPEFINWQQEYLEVLGALQYLDKEFVRQQDLVKKEIAPQKQLEKVISDQMIAHAKLKGLRSRMQVADIAIPDSSTVDLQTTVNVYSPIDGFVRDIRINIGIFVEPQEELFVVVDNHHLHIDFMVFEKDLSSIKIGQTIRFYLHSKPSKVMHAKVFAIGKALDETQRTVQVHAKILEDEEELLPGMYVEGRVILEDQHVPALPEEAVALDNGLYYIFIKEDELEDEVHFKMIPVLKGVSDFGYVQVDPLEKLEKDVEIVTSGAYFLLAQTKKGQGGVGHHH